MTLDAPPARPARTLRLFVAVNLEPALRDRVFAAAQPLREALGRAVSWTGPHNLHLTLRFLGEQPAERAPFVGDALAAAARPVPAHALAIGGLGAFPDLRRPRVLWLGIEANPALSVLYNAVDRALASLDIAPEARAFHPHLTLGRVRPGAVAPTAALESVASALGERFRSAVRSVELMRSELAAGGSRYTVLRSVALADG